MRRTSTLASITRDVRREAKARRKADREVLLGSADWLRPVMTRDWYGTNQEADDPAPVAEAAPITSTPVSGCEPTCARLPRHRGACRTTLRRRAA